MIELLLILLCAPFLIIWRAFVLTLLWSWFVVPTFGVDDLSMPVAFGISLVVGMMARQSPCTKDTRTPAEQAGAFIIGGILLPAIALLFGWIATLFMG